MSATGPRRAGPPRTKSAGSLPRPARRPATGRIRRGRAARARRAPPRDASTSAARAAGVSRPASAAVVRSHSSPRARVVSVATGRRRPSPGGDGGWADGQPEHVAGRGPPRPPSPRTPPMRPGRSRTATTATTAAATTSGGHDAAGDGGHAGDDQEHAGRPRRRPHGGLERRAAGVRRAPPGRSPRRCSRPGSRRARRRPARGRAAASAPTTASAPAPSERAAEQHDGERAADGHRRPPGAFGRAGGAARRRPGTTRSSATTPSGARMHTETRGLPSRGPGEDARRQGRTHCSRRCTVSMSAPIAPTGARRTLARRRTTATIPRAARSSSASTARRSGSARSGGRPRRRPGATHRCGSCTRPPTSVRGGTDRRTAAGTAPRPGHHRRGLHRRPAHRTGRAGVDRGRPGRARRRPAAGRGGRPARWSWAARPPVRPTRWCWPRWPPGWPPTPPRRSSSSPAAAGRRPDGRPVVAILGVGDRADDEAVAAVRRDRRAAVRRPALAAADPRPRSRTSPPAGSTTPTRGPQRFPDLDVHDGPSCPAARANQVLGAACPSPLLVISAGHGTLLHRSLDGPHRWLLRHCTSPMALVPVGAPVRAGRRDEDATPPA